MVFNLLGSRFFGLCAIKQFMSFVIDVGNAFHFIVLSLYQRKGHIFFQGRRIFYEEGGFLGLG